MAALGATIVDPIDTRRPVRRISTPSSPCCSSSSRCRSPQYLAGLSHTSMRTLADLIAFNVAHCREEMKYFGQELFELAEATSGDLTDPVYLAARALSLRIRAASRASTRRCARDDLDAIVAPSYSFASSPAGGRRLPEHLRAGRSDAATATGGHLDVRGFLHEPKLLALRLRPRAGDTARTPAGVARLGSAGAGGCRHLRRAAEKAHRCGKAHMPHHLGTGKPFKR